MNSNYYSAGSVILWLMHEMFNSNDMRCEDRETQYLQPVFTKTRKIFANMEGLILWQGILNLWYSPRYIYLLKSIISSDLFLFYPLNILTSSLKIINEVWYINVIIDNETYINGPKCIHVSWYYYYHCGLSWITSYLKNVFFI